MTVIPEPLEPATEPDVVPPSDPGLPPIHPDDPPEPDTEPVPA